MPNPLFGVDFVAEHELPDGHDWVLVRVRPEGETPPRKHLFIKRDCEVSKVMGDVWAALHRTR